MNPTLSEFLNQHVAGGPCFHGIEEVGPTTRGTFGDTPLHVAASLGRTDIVEALLAEGADPNAQGECGETPLHVAFFFGHSACADTLLAAGGTLDIPDEDGLTPEDVRDYREHQHKG